MHHYQVTCHNIIISMATMTDLELVSNGSISTVSTYTLKRSIEGTDTTSEKKQKLATNSSTTTSITEGVYVREASQPRGDGASRPEIQQRVGEMLGLFKIVAVPTKSILDEEQATLIAASLQHDSIVDNDKPITSYEKTRLLNDRANHPVIECQCKVQVHKHLPSLEPSFAISLKSIIGSAAELGGDMKGGNLTNCGVELLN